MDSTHMEALSALLDEKRRYEGWLAQLESRRDAAPSHVVERVRGDYAERLRGVTEQLRGRASELEATATSLASRIAVLVADETARRDSRAETELRAGVGELSAESAGIAFATCDEDIARLSAERATLGAELGRVQDILLQAQTAPAAIAVPSPAPDPPPVPSPAVTVPSAPRQAFDDLAFLQKVVQPGSTVHGAPAAQPVDQLRVSAPDHGTHVQRQPTTEEANAVRIPSLTPEGMATFFKDVPAEQAKTLKCQECGTMNYPTEWYCERCGGELAAM